MQYFKKGFFGAIGALVGCAFITYLADIVRDKLTDSEKKEAEVKEKYEEYKKSEEEVTE